MESWSALDVPALPGQGDRLNVFDTSSGTVVATAPEATARMYVCGITPYDATHMGHASTYVAFDVMQRVWRDEGLDVNYVQNVTDIDDPLLERAVATGQDWTQLARAETALFSEDMSALNVLPPRAFIGAVESIPQVVALVQRLVDLGAAYSVGDDIYYSIASDSGFGRVSGLDRDDMVTLANERGGDPERTGKKDPLDPVLWQAERPGEPAWDTALGHGRPGWHIECVAIARDQLGIAFDIQGGGSDLTFPHHEMGASQAHTLADGVPFARAYVHAGMVALNGEKMSKSKGNLVFVSRLRDDGHDPMAIRLALLAHHYRSNWEWQDEDLAAAERRLHLWRMGVTADRGPNAADLLRTVRAALADDVDAPLAVAAIDRWVEQATGGEGDDEAAPSLVGDICHALLGVNLV